jgi:hypothetical protein
MSDPQVVVITDTTAKEVTAGDRSTLGVRQPPASVSLRADRER